LSEMDLRALSLEELEKQYKMPSKKSRSEATPWAKSYGTVF